MDQKQVNNVLMDTNNFKTIFFNYFPAISLLWFFAIILSSPDRNLLQISGGITFMNFWAYFIHKGLHNLPREGFIGYINTHWLFHHQQTKLIDRRLELSLEFFTDLAMNLSILILQVFSGIWFVPLSVVLFYTLVYTSVHIINYSIFGSPVHRNHHKNLDTNFGPDMVDHIFSTNHDDTIEDMKPFIINAIVAFTVVLCLKAYFKWED